MLRELCEGECFFFFCLNGLLVLENALKLFKSPYCVPRKIRASEVHQPQACFSLLEPYIYTHGLCRR
jgi:hypothetical protein